MDSRILEFNTRASNLLYDMTHKMSDDNIKECEVILK